MNIRFYLSLFIFFSFQFSGISPLLAQLHFEGLVYNGQGNALLDGATASSFSPDGAFLYVTSAEADAISVFYKNPDDGSLTFVDVEKNETAGVFGIGGAYGVLVSPDGKHVYVAGSKDNAIGVFNRNEQDGSLTYLGMVENEFNGVEDLIAPLFMATSPDGNHIYVTSPEEDALLIFKRNVLTGALSFIGKEKDGINAVDGLSNPISVQLSPDGRHVYVSGRDDGAICLFERNSLSGHLNFITAFQDGSSPNIVGLYDAYALAMSSTGDFLYATSADESSILAFERNPLTGFLSFKDLVLDDTDGVDGLENAISISLSPDGKYIYAIGADENSIAIFSWNDLAGEFQFISKIENGSNGITQLINPSSILHSPNDNYLYVTTKGSGKLLVFEKDNATGNLMFKDQIEGEDNGLDRPISSAFSPDGNHVYVAGYEAHSLSVFERNPINGSMDFIEYFTDDTNGIDGLKHIEDVAVSPDGLHVYAAGHGEDAIVVFARNPNTGTLSYGGTIKDNIAGVNGLDGVKSLVLSPDGASLYAASYWENAIAVFARNSTTGALSFVEMLQDGIGGVDGLALVNEIIISDDGAYAYTISFWDDAIAVFQRNTLSGALEFQQIIRDGFAGVDGLDGGESICLSSDGMHLYAAGFFDHAIAQFSRNPDNGLLQFEEVYKNGIAGVEGLQGVKSINIDPEGSHVYVCSTGGDNVSVFLRDEINGNLSFEKTQIDGVGGVNGIDQPEQINLSPDGKYIYVCGGKDDAVAYFSCSYFTDLQQTICLGDSVLVGTNSYSEAGIYLDTIDAGSCQTFIQLELEVAPAVTNIEVSICTGDAYFMAGNSYDSSGTYTETLTTVLGCDSTVNLNLTVEDVLTENVVLSICEGESINVGTNVYTTTGNYSDQLLAENGCDSIVNIDLTVMAPIEIVLNETICTGDFFVMGTSNYHQTGIYTESFSAENGCDSIVTLNLNTLATSSSIIDVTICANEEYWLGEIAYNSAGTFVGELQNAAGCDSIVTLNLSVLEAPIETTNHTICVGATYLWEGNAYTSAGTYEESYPIGNGCVATRILHLNVQEDTYEKQVQICEGENYSFAGLDLTEDGVYTNTFTSSYACDSLVILYFSVVPAQLAIDAEICEGDTYLLGTSSYDQSGIYVDTILGAMGCTQEVSLNLEVVESLTSTVDTTICAGETYQIDNIAYTSSGIYVESILSNYGCDSTVTLHLTVLPEMVATETIEEDHGTGSGSIALDLQGGAPPYSFSWSNGASTQDIYNLVAGEYTVSITDDQACHFSQSYIIDSSVGFKEEEATHFTLLLYPNPVPKDQQVRLQFETRASQNVVLQIYDSLGQLISSENTQISMGASQKEIDSPLLPGVYFIQIVDVFGKSLTQKFVVQ